MPKPDDRFLNRELSWLEFNRRVLEQSANKSVPLLERAKFLAITSSNLDEFMMVRIGSLKMQHDRNPGATDPSGMTVGEQLIAVAACVQNMVGRQYEIFSEQVCAELTGAGIQRIDLATADASALDDAETKFLRDVVPVISPQIVSQHRPFPSLQGLGLHLCVRLRTAAPPQEDQDDAPEEFDFAIIPIGRALQRVVSMPAGEGFRYLLLEQLVAHFVGHYFPGREVIECVPFRVVRNADVELREDEAADLMVGMEDLLESRRISRVVRLEYGSTASDPMLTFLSEKMELSGSDLYPIDGPIDLTYLFGLHGLDGYDSLRDPPWPPVRVPQIAPDRPVFESIEAGDILMVHPYESFDPVVRMIEEAAADPDVLAIKQALYRTSRNSPIVAALMRAARAGKYVSAIVELKARFDEARNIEWAREMEQSGVQVIYGVRGLKTHAKICIIVRRTGGRIRRYVHFGTGNYNEVTARLYSDVSLLTCEEEFGADASSFFNAVSGASQPQPMAQLSAAPLTLRQRILDLIEGEARRSRQGQRAEIIAKLNALVDTEVIDALYDASQAGVPIRLNIRGICCLKPGVPGLSETIEVVSIIDRYLEHARILYFRHGGDRQLFISSADWMPRNLNRRVELMTPIIDEAARERLRRTLNSYFKDNVSAWRMDSTGGYQKAETDGRPYRSQLRLQQRIREESLADMASRKSQFETQTSR
ncbi:MAG: polyphosphate kinase 1 [Planctomycetota bacterium]